MQRKDEVRPIDAKASRDSLHISEIPLEEGSQIKAYSIIERFLSKSI